MKSDKQQVITSTPECGFLRLSQIVGRPAVTKEEAERNLCDAETAKALGQKPNKKPKCARNAIPSIIPISKSHWWAGVKDGRFPQPVKLGPRTTVWRASDIQAVIDRFDNQRESS